MPDETGTYILYLRAPHLRPRRSRPRTTWPRRSRSASWLTAGEAEGEGGRLGRPDRAASRGSPARSAPTAARASWPSRWTVAPGAGVTSSSTTSLPGVPQTMANTAPSRVV